MITPSLVPKDGMVTRILTWFVHNLDAIQDILSVKTNTGSYSLPYKHTHRHDMVSQRPMLKLCFPHAAMDVEQRLRRTAGHCSLGTVLGIKRGKKKGKKTKTEFRNNGLN